MTKGRKTTQEERAQIVAFCIEHGKDYALTMETYQVSYQQVYSWVRKYEASGVDGLVDRRGKLKNVWENVERGKKDASRSTVGAEERDAAVEFGAG